MLIKATDDLRWRTSSYTNGGNDPQCVEVGFPSGGGYAAVQDTKNRGPALAFPERAFAAFVNGLRRERGDS